MKFKKEDFSTTKIKRWKQKKRISINLRLTVNLCKWLKENNYSPTGIFLEAVRILGYKEE